MKKVLYVAMAVLAFTFTACGSKSGETNADAPADQADAAAVEGTKYECANYSFTCPKEFKGEENALGYNANSEDGAQLSVAFNEMGPTVDQLQEAAKNWVSMKESQGETVQEPKVDGKVLTIRSTKDGNIIDFYIVVGEGTKGVSGTMTYPEAQAEKYGPLFEPMLKSFVIK